MSPSDETRLHRGPDPEEEQVTSQEAPTAMEASELPEDRGTASERTFHRLLVNSLISGVTSTFLWFALTFWVYVETRSVVATGVIGGAFAISAAILGPIAGTYVDRHRKIVAMRLATAASIAAFTVATAVFVAIDADDLLRIDSPWFWALILTTLLGSVAGQMRSIALSTCVTLLVPEGRRDRANGLVGTVTGVSFAVTSVFSGLIIGTLGMGWAYYGALVLTTVAFVHLLTIHIDEPQPDRTSTGDGGRFVDVRGALDAILAVPGLLMLVLLAAFNNLLAGVFMALMDAYGLELVSVEVWGLVWGFLSLAFIGGGLVVARFGLGSNPVRVILLGNLANWTVCAIFPLRSSIVLVIFGMLVWLSLTPAIEAAEQTVLQSAIPYERQGRVFGFAQLVENAASPLTAFLMAPLAEAVFIPLMTDGRGVDWIGGWFGTGPDRGLALMFVLAGLIGIVVTALARLSRSYRHLATGTATSAAPAG